MDRRARNAELRPTNDYESMVRLGRQAGLEIEQLGPVLDAYGLFENDKMVGCACLREREGAYLLECLAVSERFRGIGLGTRLVRAVEADAKARGATRLRALARSPGFFLKIGYRVANPMEVDYPSTASCGGCPQLNKSCFPSVVIRDL